MWVSDIDYATVHRIYNVHTHTHICILYIYIYICVCVCIHYMRVTDKIGMRLATLRLGVTEGIMREITNKTEPV